MIDVQDYEPWGLPQFIKHFGNRFNRHRTAWVYEEYLKFWDGEHVSKIGFSRYITAFTEYQVKSISVGGQKFRAFVKKNRVALYAPKVAESSCSWSTWQLIFKDSDYTPERRDILGV